MASLAARSRLARELQYPHQLYMAAVNQVMRALLDGRFVEAERLAQQALEFGQQAQVENLDGVFGIQMFLLRREQGHLAELAPAVRYFVRQHTATAWRPGLALIYSELGLVQEARTEFEHLAQHDFTDLPRDGLWVTCITYLAEVCTFLQDTAHAATLYRLLHPYAGRNVIVGGSVACYGAASRYLGMLAAIMARWDEAEQHFQEALAMNTRTGARPWLAHTQHDYAAMLLARGQPEDQTQAMTLLEEALATARELGMRALEARLTARMSPLTHPSSHCTAKPMDFPRRLKPARGGGATPGGSREEQPGDCRHPLHQPQHSRHTRPQHPHQDRHRQPHRSGSIRPAPGLRADVRPQAVTLDKGACVVHSAPTQRLRCAR